MPLPADIGAVLDGLALFGTRLGLERMRKLLSALGDPQAGLPVVLVAGTNGKGSVAALLAAMARAGRYRTGLYTSPHLETVEERLRIGGAAIEPEVLGDVLGEVLAAAEEALDEPLTYFEALTAAAFLWFAREEVELAVMEVGLGGRLDATNVAAPVLTVVTPVDVDHAEHLGDDPATVAKEKAGIFREGVPAVVAGGGPGAIEALAAEAERVGAPLVRVSERVAVEAIQRFRPFTEPAEPTARRQRVWLRPGGEGEGPDQTAEAAEAAEAAGAEEAPAAREVYELALAGRHQAENLAVAVVAARELAALGWERLTQRAIVRGAKSCRWPGRLEEVVGPRGERVLLDVAHNPAGARALARYLEEALPAATGAGGAGGAVELLFGALADKDAGGMLAALVAEGSPVAGVTLTTPSGARGRAAAELVELVPGGVEGAAAGLGAPPARPSPGRPGRPKKKKEEVERPVRVVAEPAAALSAALRAARDAAGAGEGGRVVVVCGSLALVGEIRAELRRRWGVPEAAVEVGTGG